MGISPLFFRSYHNLGIVTTYLVHVVCVVEELLQLEVFVLHGADDQRVLARVFVRYGHVRDELAHRLALRQVVSTRRQVNLDLGGVVVHILRGDKEGVCVCVREREREMEREKERKRERERERENTLFSLCCESWKI